MVVLVLVLVLALALVLLLLLLLRTFISRFKTQFDMEVQILYEYRVLMKLMHVCRLNDRQTTEKGEQTVVSTEN